MKGLLFREPGVITLTDLGAPVAGDGEVLVQVKAAGICGSDLHGVVDGMYPHPAVLGHEFAGVAEDGARVAINPQVPCRSCASCTRGATNLCIDNSIIGITRAGGVADTVAVPRDRLVPIPDSASFTAGAMAEVVANGVHALARGGGARGKTLGIIGAGPIGLSALLCAREQGATTIVVTDLSEHRQAVATRLGADAVASSLDAGAFDLVIDAVGAASTRTASMTALRPGGTAVWIGVNDPAATLAASMEVVVSERSIVGSFAYTDAEFAHAVAICARHDFDWVSTYPLGEAEAVFADLQSGRSSIVKAHFSTEGQVYQ
ncbi:alcohol dehydrogenase catalytic domain-containing protein [Rhodococcus qingshengii]|uniref:alcohol dehydrogenase catalytic domain-containing protein n=1 Tax=Rhodococcus qingshengii TaxID=334542 RepID=UPI00210C7B8F|nr:alcohol dehydrogenase catalytic domain-containing protein [Rhodococcus qingshengii]MCQ4152521.1 alcohol dehydrogenase catalytic domain-containing protein [Rhodococcus qingshengii]